jgi:Protein of unknown function (DUF3467)
MADQADDGKVVPIIWEVPAGLPTHYSTNLIVQHSDEDFTITFWDVRPPVLIGTREDKLRQVEELREIRPTALVRIILSPRKMREFTQVMQDNLKTFEETRADSVTEKDKK